MNETPAALSGYIENYSQTGDILVVAMCILFVILLHASYVNKTRSFLIFRVMVVMMAVAAYSNVILHVLLRSAEPMRGVLIGLRVLHFSALFVNLFLFMMYFLETMRIDGRESRRYLAVGAVALAGLILYMSVSASMNLGAFSGPEGAARGWMQVFTVGYVFFVALVAYLSLRYRGRIYRQVTVGVLASSGIAFLLLFLQGIHAQSSYTAASFLFPAVALLYLVHANPYDLDIGAVNASGFEELVKHRRKSGELLMMSLLLPEFEGVDSKYPTEIQWAIRHLTSHYFRGATLFQVSNGRMVLAMETSRNPKYEETLRTILSKFDEVHARYQLEHKIVILLSLPSDEQRDSFNYVDLIQFVESRMEMNSVHRVTPEDVEAYHRYHYIIGELGDIDAAQDMDDPRVLVYCQPVLNLHTGQYDTAEALMRLRLDKLGTVPPGEFIPLAEEFDYISTLSRIILSKTCEQIRQLTGEGYFVRRISVNFSMLDLRDPAFSEQVRGIIDSSGIPSERVAIELTESQNERDFMLVKERISELHDSGIKFYLDDFGTGYSNFDRIMELPFDIIKFDRSLVIASGADSEKRTMVSHLARMFSDAHYSVLYEGIETELDQDRCAQMCAEYLQGYKFSPPIPIERLREYFSKTAPAGAAT